MIRPPVTSTLLAAAIACAIAAPALAQAPSAPGHAADVRRLQLDAERVANDASRAAVEQAFRYELLAQADVDFDFDPDAPSYAFIAREFGSVREIVKNAPYQAEAVTETIQTLADGNRIVRRSSTLVARDGYGRTRQQKKGGIAYLYDPIDNRSWALNPERKTALRIPRAPSLAVPVPPMPPMPPMPSGAIAPPAPPPPVAAAPGIAPPAPPAPPTAGGGPGGERVVVKRSADGRTVEVSPGRVIVRRGDESREDVDDVRVEVVRIDRQGPGMGDTAALPPLSLPLMPRGKGESKPLGTREFDGVKADGRMTTHTIPAGEIGNEKPIVITGERWFSPELNVVVYAKHSDPRTGDTIYRLANLKRGEPPAEWFKVPSDYKVRRP